MLLGEPAPDFSDPLGMLRACHQRMLNLCDLLHRMVDYQNQHGVDDDLINSAHKVIRYFDLAAPHHHADEEHDLFPLLNQLPQLHQLMAQLHQEHQQHGQLWQQLRPPLQNIINANTSPALANHSQAFTTAYREHIAIENTQLLPIAKQHLNQDQLHQLGQAMAARRSL